MYIHPLPISAGHQDQNRFPFFPLNPTVLDRDGTWLSGPSSPSLALRNMFQVSPLKIKKQFLSQKQHYSVVSMDV